MGKLIEVMSGSILFRVSALRVLILFLFHAAVFVASYIFAWLVRFEFNIPPEWAASPRASLPFVVGVQLLVATFFGFYRGWWRYVGIADVIRLVFGMAAALIILVAARYAGDNFGLRDEMVKMPRGVLLIDWAFALLTLFGARVAIRVGRDHTRFNQLAGSPQKKVVIIGAGDAGETLAREIEHRPQLGMKVVAFVDDYRAKLGSFIRGIQVRGPIANVAQIVDATDAQEALIAIPSASGKKLREIIRHLAEADLKFKTMPGIDQLVSGKVHVTQLRPVNVEDLLRREKIELPGDPVRELFRGKRVLVTGAGGTIGSELAVQILELEPERVHLVERSEFALYQSLRRIERERGWLQSLAVPHLLDIRDQKNLSALLADARPQILLHAAAHKHVPLGEQNPTEYLENNTLATRQLADLCDQNGVERFVFISTDKAINPSSVMGASKRAAEILLIDLAKLSTMRMTIVRFGNVIGSSGSVIPLFMEQIGYGGPLTVTHPDVTRYFIRTSEAISLVLQAATLGTAGSIFMLDMGEPIKIVDLARDLIQLSNHSEDEIEIVFTGLRPGEKLYEEIRLQGESIHPTGHPQIVVTESSQPESSLIQRWLAKAEFAPAGTPTSTIDLLGELILEYVPGARQELSQGEAKPSSGAEPSISVH